MIDRALVTDPTTPGHVLAALALRSDGSGYLPPLLAAHPHLPDAKAPTGPHQGSGPYLADALDKALHAPAATDRTRSRVLAMVPTERLIENISTTVQPHPAVHGELVRRATSADANPTLEHVLALHPATTTTRRLTALKVALAAGIAARPLLTVAAGYPEHLTELAELTTDPDLRTTLRQYATLAARGVDVLDHHRTNALVHANQAAAHAIAAGAKPPWTNAGPWAEAITATGDQHVTEQILDLIPAWAFDLDADISRRWDIPDPEACLRAMSDSPSLRGTPVWRRILLQRIGNAFTSDDWATPAALTLAQIVKDTPASAHYAATRTRPHDPDARTLLAAGWARTREHDDDGLPRVDAVTIARYALHPAMTDTDRQAAIHAFAMHRPASNGHDGVSVRYLEPLVRAADKPGQLRHVVLHTPLPHLTHIAEYDDATEQLLSHYLARALRPHHATLTSTALTAVLALEGTFTGSTADLLHVAAGINA